MDVLDWLVRANPADLMIAQKPPPELKQELVDGVLVLHGDAGHGTADTFPFPNITSQRDSVQA